MPAWARGVRGRHQEYCDEPEGKSVAALSRSSARRVRASSWWSVPRGNKFSVVSARQEEECQELSKVIKYVSERQEKLLAMVERKRNLISEAPEDLRKQIFQEIRNLDEKISGDDMEQLERKRILEEMIKGELQLLLEVVSLGKW